MSEEFIIWLPEDLDDAWAYYKSGGTQGWAANEEERKGLSRLAGGKSLVICPGTWFRTFPHSLPEMKPSERLAAAGYAIEEKLAAPLEEQHVILGKGDDQRVGVVSQSVIGDVMARLDEYNIVPGQLIAEYEAFGADLGVLSSWGRSIQPGPMGYAMDAATEGDNPLFLMPKMQVENALNYAQGSFARSQSAGPSLRQLGMLAASVLLGLCTWLGWQWSDARAKQQQALELRAEAASLYTEATGRPAPPNYIRSLERKLSEGGETNGDFVALSALLLDGLKKIDDVSIDTLRYNETRGAITVKMVYPSFDTAAQLEQIFASSPATFQPGSVRDQNGKLIGEAEFSMGAK